MKVWILACPAAARRCCSGTGACELQVLQGGKRVSHNHHLNSLKTQTHLHKSRLLSQLYGTQLAQQFFKNTALIPQISNGQEIKNRCFIALLLLEMTELVRRVLIYRHEVWVLNYLTHDIMFPAPKPPRSELQDFFTAVPIALYGHTLVSLEIAICFLRYTICTVHGLLHEGTFQ